MQKPLVALALLAVLLLGALAFLLTTGDDGRGAKASSNEARAAGPAGNDASAEDLAPATELALPEAGEAETDAREAAPAPLAADAVELGDQESFGLDDARWAEVDVILPSGVPLDDELALVAFSAEAGEELNRWELRQLTRGVDLTASFVEEADKEWSRREVAGSGRIRIPFHGESESGALLLVSRYVYAPLTEVELPADEPITIEAQLGGYVTGRILLPAGVEDRGIEPYHIDLEFEGRGEAGFFGGMDDSRDVEVRDDFTFELRALSADKRYFVNAEAERLVDHRELRFQVQPGEHRVFDIALGAGGTISGTVVSTSGDPIEDADVEAESDGNAFFGNNMDAEARTDEDGSFTLWGVPTGKVTLNAYADGYLYEEDELEFEVVEGQRIEGVQIVLDVGNTIRGTVTWPGGEPAANADVAAIVRERQGWRNEVAEDRTDDDGTFTLTGLEEGPYEIIARAEPPGSAPRANAAPSLEAWDPSREWDLESSDGDGIQWRAKVADVAPNTSGLALVLEEPLTFPGVVVDDMGGPVTAFTIEAKPSGSTRWSGGLDKEFESEDGSFLFAGVYDGDYVITASAEGYSQGDDHEVAIQVPYTGAPVRLELQRAITVQGIVLDPNGDTVEGASVLASTGENEWARFGGTDVTESDENGAFTLEGLPPSGMELTARSEGWAVSAPVPVLAPPGETVTDMIVTLRVGATITGEVYAADGEPEAGVTVTAGQGQFGMFGGGENGVQTDAAGTFRIEHVPPGKITVTAMPSEDDILDQLETAQGNEEAAMMNFFGQMRMETVEVADGEEVHVVLGAEAKAPVRVWGTVTEAGEPVANGTVIVIEEGGSLLQGMKVARTDASGAYEVTVDRPGAFVFNAGRGDGFGSGMGQQVPFYVDVPEAEDYRLDLEMPMARITGRVVGIDRAPLEGISVQLVKAGGVMGIFDFDQSRNRVTGADGAFSFEHVEPGRYSIHAGGGSMNFLVDSSQHYGAEVVEGIEVGEDELVEGVEVQLSRAGRLIGKVVNGAGEPVSGAAVFVRDASGFVVSHISTTMTNGTGEFVYDGVPTEDVTVFARKDELTSVEVGPVGVSEGTDTEVTLVLEEGCMFVVALESDGEPIRARIEVLDEDGRQVNGLFSMESIQEMLAEGVDSKERRIGPVPPGKYKLLAVSPDGKETRKTVTVRPGQDERRVRLRLK